MPNHVRLSEGGFHAYAPVDLVTAEMHRLVEELRGDDFARAHPVLQAAYAHYALVCIHPFADGNGRVARALASAFTYRSHSVPLLILLEHKPQYLAALRTADEGEAQVFVDFVFERTVDAISLIEQTLKAAAAPDPEVEAARLVEAFRSRGGYDLEQVEAAGLALVSAFVEAFNQIGESLRVPGQLEIRSVSGVPSPRATSKAGYRATLQPGGALITVAASPPVDLTLHRRIGLEVPVNPTVDEDLLLVDSEQQVIFTARLRELIPRPTTAFQLRLGVAVRRIMGEALSQLSQLPSRKT